MGIDSSFVMPGFGGVIGHVYNFFKDYAATAVLVACAIAAFRRAVVKPERYNVPARYGKDHTAEALFVLGLISTLMISESLFEASSVAANVQTGLHAEFLAPASLAWFFKNALLSASIETLQAIHLAAYYIHDLTFFFFLCFLPLGKHFHVITSLFNVFFMRLDKGNVKPVQYGIKDEELDELESFGVKPRGFHLEAHPRFLFLRRLRPLLGPVPGQRRRAAPVAAVHLHQGPGLRLQNYPSTLTAARSKRADP